MKVKQEFDHRLQSPALQTISKEEEYPNMKTKAKVKIKIHSETTLLKKDIGLIM